MTVTEAQSPRSSRASAPTARYQIEREIGRGGMATVHEARHAGLDRRVALKRLDAKLAADPTVRERFLQEARLLARLHHPHIVEVFDVGVEDGIPFIVMPILEGETLASYMARRGPLSPEAIADILLPVISAVDAAHEAGVVHRDLKPENIFLARARDGALHPVVLDFGISKCTRPEEARRFTLADAIVGTPHYLAPELTRGAQHATVMSDQYAVGVILFECATGTSAYDGESPYAIMHAIVTSPLAAPSTLRPSLPASFDEMVLRATHKTPSGRHPSMRALGAALLSFANKRAWYRWAPEIAGSRPTGDAAGTVSDARAISAARVTPADASAPPRTPAARSRLSSSAATGRPSTVPIAPFTSSSRPMRAHWRAISVAAAALLLGVALLGIRARTQAHAISSAAAAENARVSTTVSATPSTAPAPSGGVAETARATPAAAAPVAAHIAAAASAAPFASVAPVASVTPVASAAKTRGRPPSREAARRNLLGSNKAPIIVD